MISKIYIPIGEKFSLRKETFQCIADDEAGVACYKCAFYNLEPHYCNSVSFLMNERPDRGKIIFIRDNSKSKKERNIMTIINLTKKRGMDSDKVVAIIYSVCDGSGF